MGVAMAGNTLVQGEFCPQVWVSIGLISSLINMARIKSNECSSRARKIYEKYVKDKEKMKNYIPSLCYSPVLLSTNRLWSGMESLTKTRTVMTCTLFTY